MTQLTNTLREITPLSVINSIKDIRASSRDLSYFFYKSISRTDIVNFESSNEEFNPVHFKKFEYGREEDFVIRKPDYSLDPLPTGFLDKVGHFNVSRPYILQIEDAELVGDNAVAFDSVGNLIAETTVPFFYRRVGDGLPVRTLIDKRIYKPTEIIELAASIVNVWGHNYWHWVADCLTRLEGLSYYEKFTGLKPKLIVPSNIKQWQLDFLDALGYPSSELIRWNYRKVKVKSLIVPSFRRSSGKGISPETCKWMRQTAFKYSPGLISENPFSRKVFISRKSMIRRRVLNEDEVMRMLEPKGFIAYEPEKMSVLDQIKLFSGAKFIVTSHGSALTNMIFSESLNLVEMFGLEKNPVMFSLAKSLGYRYAYFEAQPVGRDLLVDIDKLDELLNQAEMCS